MDEFMKECMHDQYKQKGKDFDQSVVICMNMKEDHPGKSYAACRTGVKVEKTEPRIESEPSGANEHCETVSMVGSIMSP